jgi:FkbM family methyltransferase
MIQQDLVFDLGMHKGEDTAFYLAKGYRVVAVEADPELVAHCRLRFSEAIRDGRVRIVEGAIAPGSESARVAFYRNPKRTIWGTIDPQWVERNQKSRQDVICIEVPRVEIGQVFRVYGVPRYLKIDIEGADRLVLDALRPLPQRPPYLSIESEKVEFSLLEAELKTLSELGYKRFAAVQQAGIGKSTVVTRNLLGDLIEFEFEGGASGVFGDDIVGWMSLEECLGRYRTIFKLYRWFGDRPLIAKVPGGRLIRSIVRRWIVRAPLPGWYDTHAAVD